MLGLWLGSVWGTSDLKIRSRLVVFQPPLSNLEKSRRVLVSRARLGRTCRSKSRPARYVKRCLFGALLPDYCASLPLSCGPQPDLKLPAWCPGAAGDEVIPFSATITRRPPFFFGGGDFRRLLLVT